MSRYINPVQQEEKGTDGLPYDGCKLYFYSVGTVVKKTIYKDSTFATAQTNPVIADANGRFTGEIFLNGLYDVYLYDPDDVLIWGPYTVGEATEGPFQLWSSDNTYDIPDIVLGSDDNYYRTLVDTNTGNDPVSSPGSWEQLQLGRVWNSTVTYSKGDTVYASDGFLYASTVDSNLANNPVSSPTQWRGGTNACQSAIAGGTVDAITATFPIPFTALNDQTIVFVRASGANTSTAPTFSPDGLTVKTIVKNGNQALLSGDIFGSSHELVLKYNNLNDVWELLNPAVAGNIVQRVIATDATSTTGTTIMPYDDTIPQNTEGDEYITATITPKFSNSKLLINFNGHFANSSATSTVGAIFQDSTADALSASVSPASANVMYEMSIYHDMTAGTTSATTFKIRIGPAAAATITSNGFSGARKLGGILALKLEILEVRV